MFGEIIDGMMYCNDVGKNAEMCWNELSKHFPNIEIDEFVVMPNHVHGIVIINDDRRRGLINQTLRINHG
jgi:REP element-mobilizing transposase RayT